jgi:hypothetical protein
VAERPSALPPVFGKERVIPREEPHPLTDDWLLLKMRASVNDSRNIVRRTQELVEQARIMLRELDIRGVDGRRIS